MLSAEKGKSESGVPRVGRRSLCFIFKISDYDYQNFEWRRRPQIECRCHG